MACPLDESPNREPAGPERVNAVKRLLRDEEGKVRLQIHHSCVESSVTWGCAPRPTGQLRRSVIVRTRISIDSEP